MATKSEFIQCPNCGSDDLGFDGDIVTNSGWQVDMKCNDCGKEYVVDGFHCNIEYTDREEI